MTKEKRKFQPLTSSDICSLYGILFREGIVSFIQTTETKDKLEAMVENITGASFGTDHYKTSEEKAVAYLYFIIKDHVFIDGNKRMACLSFLAFCDINNLDPLFSDFTLDELAVALEKINTRDHHGLIKDVVQIIF